MAEEDVIIIDDDEYDFWMEPFELEIEERKREEVALKDSSNKRKREEATEEGSSNKRIDWMDPFDVEKLEMAIKERQRKEAAEKDSFRIDFRFESDDEYDWMDPVEVEKLEIEIEEIEERQREKAADEDSSRIAFRFEIDDMEEFLQKKRERRSKKNFETSIVQLIKHQEVGLEKRRTNSLRKFLLFHELHVALEN